MNAENVSIFNVKHCQNLSKIERFGKIANAFYLLTIFVNRSILMFARIPNTLRIPVS